MSEYQSTFESNPFNFTSMRENLEDTRTLTENVFDAQELSDQEVEGSGNLNSVSESDAFNFSSLLEDFEDGQRLSEAFKEFWDQDVEISDVEDDDDFEMDSVSESDASNIDRLMTEILDCPQSGSAAFQKFWGDKNLLSDQDCEKLLKNFFNCDPGNSSDEKKL
uniref:Uncharacterized protein n=1 Tax=Panagrolaimus sp. JU765 TaxID=591449 RepID=A0AC34QDH3_9BILA